MSDSDNGEKNLPMPWRKVQGAIWLIGLAILAWQDWWWPGILILVAISGNGDPMPVLLDICRGNDWAVFDSVVGEYLNTKDPSDIGWHAYHAHRDGKVVAPDEG